MLKWYWGPPANPGQMKFHTGTLLSKPKGEPRKAQKQFATHEILYLYGLQIGKSFIGRVAFGHWGAECGEWEPWAPKRASRRPLPHSKEGGT